MPTLVIKSFPEDLHARLKRTAAVHRRSVTQETIHLIEAALNAEAAVMPAHGKGTYCSAPKLLPEYQSLLESGALYGGTDSTVALSEERDTR